MHQMSNSDNNGDSDSSIKSSNGNGAGEKEKPGDGDTTDDDDSRSKHWRPNEARGCSFFFSEAAARRFLRRNGLLCLVRAHEVQELGYQAHFLRAQKEVEEGGAGAITEEGEDGEVKNNDLENDHDGNTPSPGFGFSGTSLAPVITVFSAPNYCGRYGNRAALLQLGHGEPPPPVLASSSRDNVGSKDDVTISNGNSTPSKVNAATVTDTTRRPPIPTNFSTDHGEIRWRTFDAVEEPEPLEDHSHTSNPMDTIRTNCPYMPLTFPELLKCAKEIGPASSFSKGGHSHGVKPEPRLGPVRSSSNSATSQRGKTSSSCSDITTAPEPKANASAAPTVAEVAEKHRGRSRVASSPPALFKPFENSKNANGASALRAVDETDAAFVEEPLTETAALLRSVGLEAFASTFELAGVTPKDWALVSKKYVQIYVHCLRSLSIKISMICQHYCHFFKTSDVNR